MRERGAKSALCFFFPALALLAAPGAVSRPVTLLADLPEAVEEALRAIGAPLPEEPSALLRAVLEAAPPYRFDCGPLVAFTDQRWFSTIPRDEAGAPMLEIRRWPGDTVLAFYDLAGEEVSPSGAPPLARGKLVHKAGGQNMDERWEGTLDTSLGPRPVVWLERPVPGTGSRLGVLVAPGDAGLGREAVQGLVAEAFAVVERVEIRADVWRESGSGGRAPAPALPEFDAPPGEADERTDPWQVASAPGFTIGLPPGVRARRLDQVAPPRAAPKGSLLWIRGRFVDRHAQRVAIGDDARAGYVAYVSLESAWARGATAPLGASRATRVAAEDFSLAVEDSGAEAARVERWSEPGRDGEWIVFRLVFEKAGVEIGLPVLSGRRSESLFWIPATLRAEGFPPAAPPVDPAERFGIAFDQFTKLEQRRRPWSEGLLTLPGLRLELPKGWSPQTTLRSREGFPVSLFDVRGRRAGRIELVPDGTDILAEGDGKAWAAERRPKPRHPEAIYRRADGARLCVTATGRRYLLLPEAAGAANAEWERMAASAALERAPR